MTIATVNPATGKTERSFEPYSDAEIEERLSTAAMAWAAYRHSTFEERAHLLTGAADLLEGELPDIASVVTTEMGKTFSSAKGEVAKCARTFRFYAEHGEAMLADREVPTKATDSRVVLRPVGPVLAVMPWNFPWWQVVRFAAPALMAGNVGLLKHASNVPQTALAIEDLLRRAGFPKGAFQSLLVPTDRVASLIADARVAAVTLTGSDGAGAAVAEAAGRALKKSVLELGGSDPFVVLPSANLERAAAVGAEARVQNSGQSCIAAKRFIVHADVYDTFVEAFTTAMQAVSVGDPFDPASQVGPLALASGRRNVHAQVEDARAKGAAVRCGGWVPEGDGWYYPPTVLTEVTEAMRVWREEVFGPVATVVPARDLEEAIRLANETPYGLGASVWTADAAEQERCVASLDVGMIFVNAMVESMPELPFGGMKRSGYGRELSIEGIREFCAPKSVFVA